MDWAVGSIYSADPGIDSYHLISSYHTMKIHPLTFTTSGLTHLISRFCRYMYLCGSLQLSSIVSSNPLPTLCEAEPLTLMSSHWMPGDLQQSVDDCPSTFQLCHFTALTSAKCKSVWKPHTNLAYTPVDLTSAPNSIQMLPSPPGAN